MPSKCRARFFRKKHVNYALKGFEIQKAKEEAAEVRSEGHRNMKEVETFFIEVYPGNLSDEARGIIKKQYSMGAKSKYGMILFLDKIVSFPEWKEMAFQRFNISM